MKAREAEASWAYMVVASALKDEAGRPKLWASLCYIMRPCLKSGLEWVGSKQ